MRIVRLGPGDEGVVLAAAELQDLLILRLLEPVTPDPPAFHAQSSGVALGASPGRHLHTGVGASTKCDDCLQGRHQVRVCRHDDPHVVLPAKGHHHEVDSQRDIDPLPSGLSPGAQSGQLTGYEAAFQRVAESYLERIALLATKLAPPGTRVMDAIQEGILALTAVIRDQSVADPEPGSSALRGCPHRPARRHSS
jgi:hypothetical protein